jgi:hypothetical protein
MGDPESDEIEKNKGIIDRQNAVDAAKVKRSKVVWGFPRLQEDAANQKSGEDEEKIHSDLAAPE